MNKVRNEIFIHENGKTLCWKPKSLVEGRTMGWVGWSKLEEWSLLCALDSNMRSGKCWWWSNPSCFTDIFYHLCTYNLVQRHINKNLQSTLKERAHVPFSFDLPFPLEAFYCFPPSTWVLAKLARFSMKASSIFSPIRISREGVLSFG
jgi:hypothetical protein